WVNGLFALANPVGLLLFYLGADRLSQTAPHFLGAVLAFAAGTFVSIATSDLLPELQFHSHDRGKLSLALLAGIGVSTLIGRFEPAGHGPEAPPSEMRIQRGDDRKNDPLSSGSPASAFASADPKDIFTARPNENCKVAQMPVAGAGQRQSCLKAIYPPAPQDRADRNLFRRLSGVGAFNPGFPRPNRPI